MFQTTLRDIIEYVKKVVLENNNICIKIINLIR